VGPDVVHVVWHSFEGRYSDSSRILFERWRQQRPFDDHVWLAEQRHLPTFPPDVRTLPIYGPDSVRALERADVVVANTHTDVDWRKRPGTFYVQTWHGTPLKRIHHDALWSPAGRLDRLQRDVDRWDLLLSPNAASTPRLRLAFHYEGEVLETGYPRNDPLSSPDRDERRRRTRADYGIADDTVALLYLPTWRDDVVFADGAPIALELDPDVLLKELGPGHCLLVRGHPLVGDRLQTPDGDDVHDVSDHSDLADLYLVADLLVTDYSSAMFDFAVTGKPVVFFVYDLEEFGARTRGFYFSLADEAPGPLVRTQDELVAVVQDLPAVSAEYSDAYRAFQRRYCALEDGQATQRVLDAIFDRAAISRT
jgi:CDP-glycerol glycerophosphotransferase